MAQAIAFLSYGQLGQAGDVALTMGGLDRLATRIRGLGVEVPPLFTWDKASTIATRIGALREGTKVIVGGASLGANEAPRVAYLLSPRPIDLLFGIQPSLYGAHNVITANVKRAVNFYVPWWWPITFGLGQYQWSRAASNHATTLVAYQTFLPHPGDNADSVQNPILDEIRKLL